MAGTLKTGKELKQLAAKPDVCSAVRQNEKQHGHKYKRGSVWAFWMEDDPRADDGIMPLAKYRCVEGGDDQSWWEKIQ